MKKGFVHLIPVPCIYITTLLCQKFVEPLNRIRKKSNCFVNRTTISQLSLNLPYRHQINQPALLLAGWFAPHKRAARTKAPVPPAGEKWDSKGACPFGAVRVGPPAAQASRTAISCVNSTLSRRPESSPPGAAAGQSPSRVSPAE